MSALDNTSNPIFDAIKSEVNKLVWQLFDDIKDDEVPIHLSVFHIPINVSIKVNNLSTIIEKLVGPREFEIIPPKQV